MASLIYSFAQLEAFTAVAEHGSLMKAASKLGKDRTTLRDLIDFLEDGLCLLYTSPSPRDTR